MKASLCAPLTRKQGKPAEAPPANGVDFVGPPVFHGAAPGCVFKLGDRGQGYYKDAQPFQPTNVQLVLADLLATPDTALMEIF